MKYITPEEKRGTLGATVPGPGVTAAQAVGIEILLTFLLVFTVCASTDSKRNHYGYEVPLSIGLCVAVCHFIGVSERVQSLLHSDAVDLQGLKNEVIQQETHFLLGPMTNLVPRAFPWLRKKVLGTRLANDAVERSFLVTCNSSTWK